MLNLVVPGQNNGCGGPFDRRNRQEEFLTPDETG
jgi:hypothetical protein